MEVALLVIQALRLLFMMYLYWAMRSVGSQIAARREPEDQGEMARDVLALIEELRQTADELGTALEERGERLRQLIGEANRILKVAEERGVAEPPPGAEPPPSGRALVWQLAEQGLSATEIARTAKMGREEVELLLQLREHVER
jgi:hypothetical protein